MLSPKTPGSIYCVIVTYNGSRWVDKCFTSLQNSALLLTTLVIDNGSTDGTQELIRSGFPGVKFIQSPVNLGFGGANNLGIREALKQGADFIFLLNQDTWIEPDTLGKILTVAVKDSSFGVLSPMHLQADNKSLDRQFSNYLVPSKCRYYSDLYKGSVEEVYACEFVNAAAWLVSRKCLEAVGLFEPLFFIYGEDQNFIHRAKYHGFRIGIVPASRIVHDRAERHGKKNEQGMKLEIRIFLLIQLLNINTSVWKNIYNSLKVFVKFGMNVKSIVNLLQVMMKFFTILKARKKHKTKRYLLH